jgi:hypothetical protein
MSRPVAVIEGREELQWSDELETNDVAGDPVFLQVRVGKACGTGIALFACEAEQETDELRRQARLLTEEPDEHADERGGNGARANGDGYNRGRVLAEPAPDLLDVVLRGTGLRA